MVPLRLWPEAAVTVFRTFGIRGAAFRAAHETRRRAGRFRAAPGFDGASPVSDPLRAFRVDGRRLRESLDVAAAVERADAVVSGRYQAFGGRWAALPGSSCAWTRHPESGRPWGVDVPWWRVPHFSPDGSDIKLLWEPARFGWVYDLVRGYLLAEDDRYADAFHRRFHDWARSSPPFRGPHWVCGQETAIRAAALLYAEANLGRAPSSTGDRMAVLREALAASGERIADAFHYAVSQRNNHAISESMGLIVLGARFSEAHPEARGWLDRGRRWLERLVPEQFAEDGWYIQHSFTYCRLALDQCVLAERVLRDRGLGLSASSRGRLQAAVGLIGNVMERETGIVPNHGSNDGALVHPISISAYRDFRPVVTAVSVTFRLPLPARFRPDRDVLAWLGEPEPAAGECLLDGVVRGSSGWATARVGDTFVFLRAGRYTSRPSHMDRLHLDVRFDGSEVIVDPGTSSYAGHPPWRNGLAAGRVHNGPLPGDEEPGVRGPRFLWFAWPSATIVEARWDGEVAVLVAEVPGSVRRRVEVRSGEVLVDDRAVGAVGSLAVRWLLHPDEPPETVRVEEGSVLVGREDDPRGWFAHTYGERRPTRMVEVVREVAEGESVTTRIGRGAATAEMGGPL